VHKNKKVIKMSDKVNSVWRYLSELNIDKDDCVELIRLLSLRHNMNDNKADAIEHILNI